jgi:hypothetical protein
VRALQCVGSSGRACSARPGRAKPSKVDLRWKAKTDDQRRESNNHVKHFHVGYWAMPLSLFALAYVWLLAAHTTYADGSPSKIRPDPVVGRILGLVALIVWLWFFILQVCALRCSSLRMVMMSDSGA